MVARYAAEERFGVLMAALAAERGKLKQALSNGLSELRRRLCAALSLSEDATEEALIANFCAAGSGDEAGLRLAAAALADGSSTDRERGADIAAWWRDPGAAPIRCLPTTPARF